MESTITGRTAIIGHIAHTGQVTRVTLRIIQVRQQRERRLLHQALLQAVALPPRQAERLQPQIHPRQLIMEPIILM